MNRRQFWLSVVGLILLTVLAYSHSLGNGFIWDDDDHFTQNPAMLSVDGLKQIWSSLTVSRYYPLTLTTFWVERRLWGLNPLPYHAVNIALHAVNAVLLWVLLRHLRMRGAWAATALWAIHPVNVETVAWVTELKNTQSGFFFLLTLLVFLRFEDESRPRDYRLTLLGGAAAMLSKPSTVVLPAVLLLCVWVRRGGWTRRDWLRVMPLAVFGGGMSVLTMIEQRRHIEVTGASDWALTAAQRLMLAGNAVWFYAGKLCWPVNLCFLYPRWDLLVSSALAWLPLAGLMIGVWVVLWHFRSTDVGRLAVFGLGWFVIALLPVLGFFDIFFFRYAFVADHFQYLAGIGLIVWAVGTGAVMIERVGKSLLTPTLSPGGERGRAFSPFSPPGKKVRMRWIIGALIVAVVLLLLGISTWRQTQIYQDDEMLWRDTLVKNPQAWLAHNNLGIVLMKTGRVDEAIHHYEQVLRIHPGYGADAECNLGVAFAQTGHAAESIKHYERALQIDPNLAGAHFNLGVILSQTGRDQEAIEQWELAVRSKPDYAEAHNNLGVILARLGRIAEAIGHYEQALRSNPNYAEAHNNLGAAFEQAGRVPEAIEQYELALRIQRDLDAARQSLARLQGGRQSGTNGRDAN